MAQGSCHQIVSPRPVPNSAIGGEEVLTNINCVGENEGWAVTSQQSSPPQRKKWSNQPWLAVIGVLEHGAWRRSEQDNVFVVSLTHRGETKVESRDERCVKEMENSPTILYLLPAPLFFQRPCHSSRSQKLDHLLPPMAPQTPFALLVLILTVASTGCAKSPNTSCRNIPGDADWPSKFN